MITCFPRNIILVQKKENLQAYDFRVKYGKKYIFMDEKSLKGYKYEKI